MTGQPSRDELQARIQDLEKELCKSRQRVDALAEIEDKFETLLKSIQEGYFELDLDGNYTFVNDANCRFLGYSRDELTGMNARRHTPSEEAHQKLVVAYTRLYETGEPIESLEVEAIRKDGTPVIYETSVTLRRNANAEVIGFRGVSRDITERKKMEAEREGLIDDLQKSLAEVRQLSGLLPICASCKKIRNDKGEWEHLESYIVARSETEFSHGICPQCLKELYSEYYQGK